jgi:fructose-1-phosphate kinase PfkB-like protein
VWNPNPTLDVVSELPALIPGTVHGALAQTLSPGGKGTLVVTALARLGGTCLGLTPVAGASGRLFATLVEESGLPFELTTVEGMTRMAVSVVDQSSGDATVVNGFGPNTDDAAWATHVARLEQLLASEAFDYFVVAGRPPLTAPPILTAQMCLAAQRVGARAVVDVASPVLEAVLQVKPWLVKVNLREAEAVTATHGGAVDAVRVLRRLGARNAIVTDGPHDVGADFLGMALRISPPAVQSRSGVGCGDCFLAGLLHSLEREIPGQQALCWAVAVGSAAQKHSCPATSIQPESMHCCKKSGPRLSSRIPRARWQLHTTHHVRQRRVLHGVP